jgi:hypothetical protein
LEIKDLLHSKRYTIAGAKRYLKERRKGSSPTPQNGQELTIRDLREEIAMIRDLLSD